MDYSRIDEARTEALDWCILASAMVAAVLIPSIGTGFFFFDKKQIHSFQQHEATRRIT
jgi:hypothetical protein